MSRKSRKYRGCTAYLPYTTSSGAKRTRVGEVIGHTPWEEGRPQSITVQFKNGKTETHSISAFRIEPNVTPKTWRDILSLNRLTHGIQHIGVCIKHHTRPEATTLFDRRTGEELTGKIHSVEECTVFLRKGYKIANEGKPSLNESYTVYRAGSVEICMETNHY